MDQPAPDSRPQSAAHSRTHRRPADALSRYQLPTPAVIVGPVDDNDEPLPRSIKGWDPTDVDEWDAQRQKRAPRGARRDA